MQKREEYLSAQINGNNLQPLAGAEVTVTDNATGLPAVLYQDDELTIIPQPLTTNDQGYFGYKASNGEYTETYSGVRFPTFTGQVVLLDPSDAALTLSAGVMAALGQSDGATKVGYGSRKVADKLGEFVSVKDSPFGAVGDGVADDTAAIQAAIDFCCAGYGTGFNTIGSAVSSSSATWPELVFPAGRYKVSSTLRVTAPIAIRGAGRASTKIIPSSTFAATSNNAVLDISRADGHWLLDMRISGLTVDGKGKTAVPVYGKYLHNYQIDDLGACNGAIGLHLDGSYSGRIGVVSLYQNTVACRLRGLYTPSTQEANDIHISGLQIYDAGVGLEVGGGLNIHVSGLIQYVQNEAISVFDNLALLDLSNLYMEDWQRALPEYSLSAYAIKTPVSGSGKLLGKLVMGKCTIVANKPVVLLDQVMQATFTDCYWHTSTNVVNIASTSPLNVFHYDRCYPKRATGTAPQEFYGYIIQNNSATLRPELKASSLVTGNNATNTADTNFAYGFSGQLVAAKCGKLVLDMMVPFALRYTASMTNLKVISGQGDSTGFDAGLHSYFIDADGVTLENFKFKSSVSTQDAGIGDTATGVYIGGTYNNATRMTVRNVAFENTAGARAVEFGRNLQKSTIQGCYLNTSGASKAHLVSKKCVYQGISSNDDTGGSMTTNAQTQDNVYINTTPVAAGGTNNRTV